MLISYLGPMVPQLIKPEVAKRGERSCLGLTDWSWDPFAVEYLILFKARLAVVVIDQSQHEVAIVGPQSRGSRVSQNRDAENIESVFLGESVHVTHGCRWDVFEVGGRWSRGRAQKGHGLVR